MAQKEAEIDTAYAIAHQIREFVNSIDRPGQWRVSIPVEVFGDVKDELDPDESGLGTKYEGVTLCYTPNHDEPQVKYRATLDGHLRRSD